MKISLNNACEEKLENMTAASCGKFCGVCNKEVIDFTQLTDVELLDIIKKYPTGCGSFRTDQLYFEGGRDRVAQKRPLKMWAGLLTLISILTLKSAAAQTAREEKTETVVKTIRPCFKADTLVKPKLQTDIELRLELQIHRTVGLFSTPRESATHRFFRRLRRSIKRIF